MRQNHKFIITTAILLNRSFEKADDINQVWAGD